MTCFHPTAKKPAGGRCYIFDVVHMNVTADAGFYARHRRASESIASHFVLLRDSERHHYQLYGFRSPADCHRHPAE